MRALDEIKHRSHDLWCYRDIRRTCGRWQKSEGSILAPIRRGRVSMEL